MIEAKKNGLKNVSMIIKHFFRKEIEPENVEKRNTSNNPFGDCVEFKGSVTQPMLAVSPKVTVHLKFEETLTIM